MILILSDMDEPTTDWVIDWLIFLEKDFIRISNSNLIKIIKIFFDNNKMEAIFSVNFCNCIKIIDTRNISSYWYRRSNINIEYEGIKCENDRIKSAINDFIKSETFDALKIVNHILNSKCRINSYDDNFILKLRELEAAQNAGLSVPDTIVCSDRKSLIPFYEKHKKQIITKTIGDPHSFFPYSYSINTNKVSLENVDANFGISLFQEMLEKFVELRIFVLDNKFYSSAIFSQAHSDTKVDLKNYDIERPNRIVPFVLPDCIKEKLKHLMAELNLNSGSIDMVITPTFEYRFIEINPIGQFEQVAIPCNYNLFQLVAKYLN